MNADSASSLEKKIRQATGKDLSIAVLPAPRNGNGRRSHYANQTYSRKDLLQPLPNDYCPNEHDVICAKGNDARNHPGSKVLREHIQSYMDDYKVIESRIDRAFIVSAIIQQIKSTGGRFIRRKGGGWAEIGDRNAREKIGANFRDLLHERYSSSARAKSTRRKLEKEGITPVEIEVESHHPQRVDDPETQKIASISDRARDQWIGERLQRQRAAKQADRQPSAEEDPRLQAERQEAARQAAEEADRQLAAKQAEARQQAAKEAEMQQAAESWEEAKREMEEYNRYLKNRHNNNPQTVTEVDVETPISAPEAPLLPAQVPPRSPQMLLSQPQLGQGQLPVTPPAVEHDYHQPAAAVESPLARALAAGARETPLLSRLRQGHLPLPPTAVTYDNPTVEASLARARAYAPARLPLPPPVEFDQRAEALLARAYARAREPPLLSRLGQGLLPLPLPPAVTFDYRQAEASLLARASREPPLPLRQPQGHHLSLPPAVTYTAAAALARPYAAHPTREPPHREPPEKRRPAREPEGDYCGHNSKKLRPQLQADPASPSSSDG